MRGSGKPQPFLHLAGYNRPMADHPLARPPDSPYSPGREQRIWALAGMIVDAQAAGAALIEADWAEARFRAELIQDTAAQEGMVEIRNQAARLVHRVGQAQAGHPAGLGAAFDHLSREIDRQLDQR
jgi:hypothetical protein